jgi:O-antigen/teichoic acid export membrane protein
MVWSAIAISLVMSFISQEVILFLFGKSYKDSGNILMIYTWSSIFVFLGVASQKWFITENLQKYTLINTIIGALLNISLNYIFIPLYGGVGSAYATMISYACAAYFLNFVWPKTRKNFYLQTKSFNILEKLK